MSTPELELRPEEFAGAAAEAIAAVAGSGPREAAAALGGAGLLGVCGAEEDGGLGLGVAFALPIAIEAGRQQLPFPLIEHMLLARALAGAPEAAALCAGERLVTWAFQGSLADGLAGHAREAEACDWVLVADGEGGGALCARESLAIRRDEALDPEHPQCWLECGDARIAARISRADFDALRHDARILVAGFVHGIADAALARTADYLSTRVQFGRPLSAKQAVRHLLARMCLAREATGASVRRLLEYDEFGARRDARAPLAHAIAQAAFVVEKAIHLHGGMGFTWELPLHRGLREVRKFDAAFGAGAPAREAAADFIASA
ncbi:MAG: acyl-CoA dehydrogenase family protein [Xylophilus ampelinus]